MFKSLNRNDADDEVQDIQSDVSQLADSLENVLKSCWASDNKDEVETARRKAKTLLEAETRRINGRSRLHQKRA